MKTVVSKLVNIVMMTGLFVGLVLFTFNLPSKQVAGMEHTIPGLKVSTPRSYEAIFLIYELLQKEKVTEDTLLKQNYFTLNRPTNFPVSIRLTPSQEAVYGNNNHFPSKAKELRDILNNSTQRAQFNFVVNKLAELNMPKELALIPVIESQYNPRVVSPKGAGGLWQLMPQTAKGFGLSSQQRFEIAPSTTAALSYFKDLYKEYGNWEFAIAAYNAGDGRVNKALKQNPGAKTVQDLNLPLETRNYVQAFFALQSQLKSYQA